MLVMLLVESLECAANKAVDWFKHNHMSNIKENILPGRESEIELAERFNEYFMGGFCYPQKFERLEIEQHQTLTLRY